MVGVGELVVAAHRVALDDPRRGCRRGSRRRRRRRTPRCAARPRRRRPRARCRRAVDVDPVLQRRESRPGLTIAARCTTTSISCRSSSGTRPRHRVTSHVVVDDAVDRMRPAAARRRRPPARRPAAPRARPRRASRGIRRRRCTRTRALTTVPIVVGRGRLGRVRRGRPVPPGAPLACAAPTASRGSGPAMMSQMPHQPATMAMPPRPSKNVNTSPSPRPALRMPTSKVIALRSRRAEAADRRGRPADRQGHGVVDRDGHAGPRR